MSTSTTPVGLPALPVPGPSHSPKNTGPTPVFVDRLRLEGCDWETYERFLAAIGDRPIRCTYDRGRLEIMAPMRLHEREKSILTSMVDLMALALDQPVEPCGSMTIRRQDLDQGFEPDACFYIEHAPQMIHVDQPDFTKDPPPDLAIEVDITSSSIDRQALYAAIGVPELWRFNGEEVELYLLIGGDYRLGSVSRSFPFLTVADVNRFLATLHTVGHLESMKSFRAWLRTVIPSSGV